MIGLHDSVPSTTASGAPESTNGRPPPSRPSTSHAQRHPRPPLRRIHRRSGRRRKPSMRGFRREELTVPSIDRPPTATPRGRLGPAAFLAEHRVLRAQFGEKAPDQLLGLVSTTVTGSVGVLFARTDCPSSPCTRAPITPNTSGRRTRTCSAAVSATATATRSRSAGGDGGGIRIGPVDGRAVHAGACVYRTTSTSRAHHRYRGPAITRPNASEPTTVSTQTAISADEGLDRRETVVGARGFGVDVGGSGIKGALVDLATGRLVEERIKIETPDRRPEPGRGRGNRGRDRCPRRLERAGRRHPAERRRHGRRRPHCREHRPVLDRDRRTRRAVGCPRRPTVTVLNDADAAASPRTGSAPARTSTASSCC